MPDSTHASPPGAAASAGGAELGRNSRAGVTQQVLAGAIACAFIMLFTLGWELAARRGWVDPFFVSRPSAIAYQLFDWWHGGTSRGPLAVHVGVTLTEAALGLMAGSLAGALGGVAFRAGTLRGEVFQLFVWIFRPAPLVALAAALALGAGFGMAASAAFAAVLVFFVAVADARTHRPALATLRRRCGLALAGAVLGECFVARSGVGWLIVRAVHQFNAGGVYAAFVVLTVVALCVDMLARGGERWWLRAHVKAPVGR
ncbi:MAG TPA: hypothetical protein VNZ04_06110 [Trinickia sp.]|jgi:NitT/TauT family transport system permease protein|nr:hypothetical protein [Trinickia sp.]